MMNPEPSDLSLCGDCGELRKNRSKNFSNMSPPGPCGPGNLGALGVTVLAVPILTTAGLSCSARVTKSGGCAAAATVQQNSRRTKSRKDFMRNRLFMVSSMVMVIANVITTIRPVNRQQHRNRLLKCAVLSNQ